MKQILPARHPFRKLKSVYQLTNFNADWHGDTFEEAGRPFPNYTVLTSDREFSAENPNHKYLGRWQENDAPVLGLSWDDQRCKLTLNEYEAWRLCTALTGSDNIQINKHFPLEITFEGLTAICAWMNDEFGEFRRLKASLNNAVKGANEYVGEWILHWSEDRFFAVIELYTSAGTSKKLFSEGPPWKRCTGWHHPDLFVGIDCRSISYVEGQAEAIERYFGDRGTACYKILDQNRTLFSQGAFQPFADLAETGKLPAF